MSSTLINSLLPPELASKVEFIIKKHVSASGQEELGWDLFNLLSLVLRHGEMVGRNEALRESIERLEESLEGSK